MNTHFLRPVSRPLLLCLGLMFYGMVDRSWAAEGGQPAALDWGQASSKARAGSGAGSGPDSDPNKASPPSPSPPNPALLQRAPSRLNGASSAEPARATTSVAKPAARGLFALEDRAIIIVGGKRTTAGAVKQALLTEIAAQAGEPKTVRGGARKLGIVALSGSVPLGPQPLPNKSMTKAPGAPRLTPSTTATPSAGQTAQPVRPGVTQTISGNKQSVSLAGLRCPDNGPPKISETPGKLKAGAAGTLWGQCFGDRPGRVELIGQFPGGKLTLPFKAWDQNSVELEVPASVRGAPDHTVAVTLVTADGKTSAAMQAQFVAARERVDVPDHAWQPGAGFELASTNVGSNNPAAAGQIDRSVHVNPQCTLETMDAVVLSGGITAISGFENGPPNEAQVKIHWVGACLDTTTITKYTSIVALGDDYSFKSVCKVAFQARAWAYCPAGIAP